MQKLAKITYSIFIGMALMSCSPNYEALFKENKEQFNKSKPILNKVIVDIEKTLIGDLNTPKHLIISVDSLSKDLQEPLKDLGIASVELTVFEDRYFEKNYRVVLNVKCGWNINTLKVVQLVYAPCEGSAAENYHSYDGYHRDTWGQGDNWYIYSDSDFI